MTTFHFKRHLFVLGFAVFSTFAIAGEAEILDVKATLTGPNTYRFEVSVLHADEGWDHYANAFEILDIDGNVLGIRELAHPHVNEQPFSRSLGNVVVPQSITKVVVRAVDILHGEGEETLEIDLPHNSHN